MTAPARQALASAVLRVAEAYVATPTAARPDVSGARWRDLEAEVDAAARGNDQEAAHAAITRWERHALTELTGRGAT